MLAGECCEAAVAGAVAEFAGLELDFDAAVEGGVGIGEEVGIVEVGEGGLFEAEWDGTEPVGDVLVPKVYSSGWVQPLLFEEV